MSLNYSGFVQRFAELTASIKADANPTIIIPAAIDYAEQRIYRELDLLAVVTTDATTACSSGVRNFTLPTGIGTFITTDQVNVFTPAAVASSNATRVPLVPVSRDFLDNSYPTALSSQCATPEYFSMRSNSIIAFGPAPDAAYTIEVIGTQRPTVLSASNSSTILTQYVPDLFVAASMVFAADYMKKGADPSIAQHQQSWEAQYQTLMKSAATEQFRAKFQAEGWTAEQPNPIATPSRV